jgi:hypothetical protein
LSGDETYGSDHFLDELGQGGVDKIGYDTDNRGSTRFHIASHILVEHSNHISAAVGILRKDSLATEEAAFFTCIPVKFNGVLGLTGRDTRVGQKDTKSL